MSNPRWVTAHGKRILVEDLDTRAPSTKVRRLRSEAFVVVPLQLTARASAAMNSPQTMVWVWLLYRAWQTKSSSFTIPNTALIDYGVTRKVKYRVLRQLEIAGLITVERPPRKSPVVTLKAKVK
jgi:hypothetical protein